MRALFTALLLFFALASSAFAADKPRLVVMITVDQLRGDYPARFRDRLAPDGGLRWLMERGVWYENARFQHLSTFTAPGHATLFTGAAPAGHGIVGNDWYERSTGKPVYCVGDSRHRLLGAKTGSRSGTSPRNLTASTIGDELVMSNGHRSRVFSVSMKDRGAILPGGQYGKAFWYSKAQGTFHSSTYYFKELPSWVKAWNKRHAASSYAGKTWDLSRPEKSYVFEDNRPEETGFEGQSKTFPHVLPKDDLKTLFSRIRATPFGDRMTLDFAKSLFDKEEIGQKGVTDLLAVSFSATDYIGHGFGPNSREIEDQMLRLDALLGELIRFVEDRLGIGRALYVLSSDHGVMPIPERRRSRARGPVKAGPDPRFKTVPDYAHPEDEGSALAGGRHKTPSFLAIVEEALARRFGNKGPLILGFVNCGLYFDDAKVRKLGLKLPDVEDEAAAVIRALPGFAGAATHHDLRVGRIPKTALGGLIAGAFHEKRGPHVVMVGKPFWLLYPRWADLAAAHGSAHAYDLHVPIMIAGPGLKARRVSRRVAPKDLAITVANWLGVPVPSASEGRALTEALPR